MLYKLSRFVSEVSLFQIFTLPHQDAESNTIFMDSTEWQDEDNKEVHLPQKMLESK